METSLIEYIIGGALLVIALVLIGFIMLQQSKRKGLSGAISGSSSNDSYFGKNRAKTKERFYSKLTTILGVLFAVLVLTLYIIHAKREDAAQEAANTSSVASEEVSEAASTASEAAVESIASEAADTSSEAADTSAAE